MLIYFGTVHMVPCLNKGVNMFGLNKNEDQENKNKIEQLEDKVEELENKIANIMDVLEIQEDEEIEDSIDEDESEED